MGFDADRVKATYKELHEAAEHGGYHLNPDQEWTLRLIDGLLVNEGRYGYPSCPCRLASGEKDADLDIVCPCDYRDPDLTEFGACYCALYVSDDVLSGKLGVAPVPERRPAVPPKRQDAAPAPGIRLWRCRVCGYLCAREHPPGTCPVCKAKSDRFETFILPLSAVPTG